MRRGERSSASVDSLGNILSGLFSLDPEDREALLNPILEALFAGDTALASSLLDRVFTRYFEADGDISLIRDAITAVFDSGFLPFSGRPALELEREAYFLAGKVQHRVSALKRYETERRQTSLNSLKCDLLCARDRDSLVPILACHLPSIGMDTVAVVLNDSDEASRSLGWFCPDGIFPASSSPFPAKRLLCAEAEASFLSGAYLVQPLFMENQPLGYIVHNVPFDDGNIYEELRSAIGSALKGIFLFEETMRAKKAAEEAELARTEFFSRIGSELVDPLEAMLAELEPLNPGEGYASDADRVSLPRLRAALASHLERTKRSIDVTLSLSNEMTLDRKILYPAAVIAEAEGFPPVMADRERLERAVAALRSAFSLPVRPALRCEGLELTFTADGPYPASLWTSGDLVFAERTILLHGGSLERTATGCTACIPWPTLSGLPSERQKSARRDALILPGGLPSIELPSCERVPYRDREPSRDDAAVALLWNAEGAAMEDRLEVLALRHRPEYFRAPFIYEGPPLEGENLISSIEASLGKGRRGPVLFVGLDPQDFALWFEQGQSLVIPSMDRLEAVSDNAVPSLIVLPDTDVESVNRIRCLSATARVPVAVLPVSVRSELEIEALCKQPLVMLCNRSVAACPEVSRRMRGIAAGNETLPAHTGALVKRAILYMNLHYASQLARWKLADTVNVSEDYLTRIFHKEIGLSLWEYLNRYRITLATDLLLRTNDTINEIALATGFQDQAYFCRVFKKMHGIPPGKIRSKKSE